MTSLPIRVRLTAWYAVVLLAGLSLFGLGMWLMLRGRLIAAVDTRLEQRIAGLRASGIQTEPADRAHVQQELSEFAAETPDGTLIQLRDAGGAVIVPLPGQQPFSAPRRRPSAVVNGRPYRVVTGSLRAAGQTYAVLVAGSLDDVQAAMEDFRRLLFLMIPAVLAVACLGGYWLSVRALRPVDAITAVARSIGVRNLSSRVEVPRTGDELERMARTWNEVLERLEASVKRIRQFTADASHELRTPVALIRATAELALRRERPAADLRQALCEIETEAERMTALTESLLTMARADANGIDVAPAAVDLAEVAGRVAAQHQPLAREKGVLLESELHPTPARADADAIHRLLLILVDNALKHTPPGGRVTIAAGRDAAGALLAVADTGEGIPAAALPHIFERFYRSDPARGAGNGFGLGLSIAQAIARAHGTELRVESAEKKGARFWLLLKP